MEVLWRPSPCQGYGDCLELSFIASPIIWRGALPSPGPLPLLPGSLRGARPGNGSGGRHRCQRGLARSVWPRWHGHIPARAGHGVLGAGCVPEQQYPAEQRCPGVTRTCSSKRSSGWPLGLVGMATALGTGSSASGPAQGSTREFLCRAGGGTEQGPTLACCRCCWRPYSGTAVFL